MWVILLCTTEFDSFVIFLSTNYQRFALNVHCELLPVMFLPLKMHASGGHLVLQSKFNVIFFKLKTRKEKERGRNKEGESS